MATLVVVGAQWGDEGKGKIVHYLSEQADWIVRYQGGNNAGHTVVTEDRMFAFHLVPSGLLFPGKKGIIAHGCVVDPGALRAEVKKLEGQGISLKGRLFLSIGAHVVFPYHLRLDALQESSGGIGTTKRGIGPAYVDKASRVGIRLAEYLEADFPHWLDRALQRRASEMRTVDRLEALRSEALKARQKHLAWIRPYCADAVSLLHKAVEKGERVLFEGAQGAMLDLDFGTYPFVTSSHPIAGGACVGAGIGPSHIDDVLGVTKAYTTRVGAGPFPTEMEAPLAERLRERGKEYGVTTGRPRRIGWLDLVQLRYAIRTSGIRRLAMTKIDTLSSVDPVKVCVGYRIKGKLVEDFPLAAAGQEAARPVYKTLPGFHGDLGGVRRYGDLPLEARNYVEWIEKQLRIPVSIVSVGRGREATILRDKAFAWAR